MKNSSIEWCDHTFNPWIGCAKVSPACDNCYAEKSMPAIFQKIKWGAKEPRHKTSANTWRQPIKWNKEAEIKNKAWQSFKQQYPNLTDLELEAKGFIKPQRPKVFCASLADVFDNEVDPQWRADLFSLISQTPNLDWLILTKRIGNAQKMLRDALININLFGRGIGSDMMTKWIDNCQPKNVWLGITVCNQAEADRYIPKLLAVPAAKRFLSIEPMLGAIDLLVAFSKFQYQDFDGVRCAAMPREIDWVIVGGETGRHSRPMHPNWVRGLRDQCHDAGVPFFFKGWGDWSPYSCTFKNLSSWVAEDGSKAVDIHREIGETIWQNSLNDAANNIPPKKRYTLMEKVGKKSAGRMLDGVEHDGMPKEHV